MASMNACTGDQAKLTLQVAEWCNVRHLPGPLIGGGDTLRGRAVQMSEGGRGPGSEIEGGNYFALGRLHRRRQRTVGPFRGVGFQRVQLIAFETAEVCSTLRICYRH
jgi:hypothetical protein